MCLSAFLPACTNWMTGATAKACPTLGWSYLMAPRLCFFVKIRQNPLLSLSTTSIAMILSGHFYRRIWGHSQSINDLYFPNFIYLVVIFPICMIFFPKCEGKCSFPKSQIKSLLGNPGMIHSVRSGYGMDHAWVTECSE